MFEDLIGNTRIQSYLTNLSQEDNIPHALLFGGPTGVGKGKFARAFAKLVLKSGSKQSPPDLHEYYPQGKTGTHSIESIRSLIETVNLAPFEATWKVFIVYEADRMLPYSANALLKTFEEPASRTLIILVSSSPELLLPTIRSRCQLVPFQRIDACEMVPWLQKTFSLDFETANQIALASKGSIAQAYQEVIDKENAFDQWIVPVLAQGAFFSYSDLSKTAQKLVASIENSCKQQERQATSVELNAYQRAAQENLVAGETATHLFQQTQIVFEQILGWFRDLMLLKYRGDETFLRHIKHKQKMIQALQREQKCSLEEALKAVKEAILALQRSTPLQNVFETFFLRLQLL